MAKKKDNELTVPMYQPWTVIQGGKVEEIIEELPITTESKANRPKTIYLVAIPSGIVGAFTDKSIVDECLKDYPDAQVIELTENKRLDF